MICSASTCDPSFLAPLTVLCKSWERKMASMKAALHLSKVDPMNHPQHQGVIEKCYQHDKHAIDHNF